MVQMTFVPPVQGDGQRNFNEYRKQRQELHNQIFQRVPTEGTVVLERAMEADEQGIAGGSGMQQS